MQSIATPGASAPSLALREHSAQLTVENIPITLIDQGSGTPTLLLHGLFDSADTWGGVVERMRGRYRLLVPDLPGFGRSGAPADYDTSLPHLAQFIDNLLAAAGISEPINLVGYDIGATYGLAWAVTHPEKVRRLGILNGNFFSDYEWHPWAKLWRIPVLGELVMAAVTESAYARSHGPIRARHFARAGPRRRQAGDTGGEAHGAAFPSDPAVDGDPAVAALPEAALARRLVDLMDPAVVLVDVDDAVLLANPSARGAGHRARHPAAGARPARAGPHRAGRRQPPRRRRAARRPGRRRPPAGRRARRPAGQRHGAAARPGRAGAAGRHRGPPARGGPPRLRRQRRPRAEDAGRRAGAAGRGDRAGRGRRPGGRAALRRPDRSTRPTGWAGWCAS